VSWAANAITLAVVALVLSRVTVQNAGDLLIAAAIFGVLNSLVKPVLKLLSLPLAVITVGIAWFFVSLLMIELTSLIAGGFAVHGFVTLVLATLIVWLMNQVLDHAPGPWKDTR
jgi:putative membrane protein